MFFSASDMNKQLSQEEGGGRRVPNSIISAVHNRSGLLTPDHIVVAIVVATSTPGNRTDQTIPKWKSFSRKTTTRPCYAYAYMRTTETRTIIAVP